MYTRGSKDCRADHHRFQKRHPSLSAKTFELMFRSRRRCGHAGSNFYIEPGRHSQIGEGDLWLALTKKSTARQLHKLLLNSMKSASQVDNQFLYKATSRSRVSSITSSLTLTLPMSNNSDIVLFQSIAIEHN